MKLSIIIPAYNEERTIQEIVKRVKNQALPNNVSKEIVVVDDGSIDKTPYLLKDIKGLKLIRYERNRGKGYAIREGLKNVTGDLVLIQDADLELSPEDYPELIKPILEDKAEVVYGSRILGNRKYPFSLFYGGGRFVTFAANFLYGINITDEPIGYKLFKTSFLKSLNLQCERFEFCPEVTAKVAKRGIKIYEVPVKFTPRTIKEGKKLRIKDGLEAIWTLLKYKFKT